MTIAETSINVPMPQGLFDRVTAEAERTKRSRAYVVREAANAYLDFVDRDRAAVEREQTSSAAYQAATLERWRKNPEAAYAEILSDLTGRIETEYDDGDELGNAADLATQYEVAEDVIIRVAETLIGRGLLRPVRQYLEVVKEDS
jgi:predicted DNA-binding protein